MYAFLRRLRRDIDAQDLVEYALLVALVGLVGIAAWSVFQGRVGQAYKNYDSRTQTIYAPKDPLPKS